ncbi:MAG: ABC transporter ATP-binding protein [bacterium]|nr:ABC transporter ATP-binding protein [bacterium]
MWWHIEETEEGVRRQTVRELLPKVVLLFRKHMKFLTMGLILLIPITAAELSGPIVLQLIIDKRIPEALQTGDTSGIVRTALIFVLIIGVAAAVGYAQAITLFRLGINVIADLKERMFKHILRLGLEFHNENPPGKLLSRVESDAETFKELFGDVTVNVTRNLLLFIGIFVMMLYYDYRIGLWVLCLVPFLFAAATMYVIRMRPYWREWRAQTAIVIGYVAEYVQGIEVIQQFNYQDRARKRMHDVNMGKFRVEVPAMFFEYSFWGAFLFGEIIAIIIVLLVGIPQVFKGTLSIGIMIAFFEYIRKMFQPIMQLSEQLNFIQKSLISIERVFGILETEPNVKDGPSPKEELAFEHEIKFENVWFAYEKDNWILRNVSFVIPKKQKIAFVGSSGGGKSTIINLLLRFYDPQKGRITVDGRDIRDFPIDAWRRFLGLVLQDIYLFPGTVVDNLRVFDSSITQERIESVCQITRADGIIKKLPNDYKGVLAEKGANLSVGERQLISFARALAHDPPILVLDEATSSVDPYTERLVQEALDRLLEGRTAVIVAHRLSTIINADRILVIHSGEVVESGNHEELLDLDGIYAKLHALQFQEFNGEPTAIRGQAS